ncbi:MAG: response regulator transcription factor [Hyphomicrobiales bacterium]|nr:MAG: response regulator transcription factor [Hyphomicrobiales bacterium]
MTTTRVTVLSPSEVEREGLCRILAEYGFEIDGAHPDRWAGPSLSSLESGVSIVLIDAQSSAQALGYSQQVKLATPDCKVVIFSADCHSDTIVDAFKAGVDGYVDKHTSCEGLAKMLTLVGLGEKVIPSQPFLNMQLFNTDNLLFKGDGAPEADLSDRELDIMRGLIRGDPNKTIAQQISITEATVKVHVKSILRKVGVLNRTQAAIWGLNRGIAADPS